MIIKDMKYSVIIPIYNAEKTLGRCLDSLLPQLNNDIEVLLINDGSSDNSAEICKEYVAKSPCFKYFEQENAGVSKARNLGIDNAIGEYIFFVDSDDSLIKNAFLLIDHVFAFHKYDFIVSPLTITNNGIEKTENLNKFESVDMDTLIPRISDMICCKQLNAPLGKVYKRSIIDKNNIRYPEGCHIAEDRSFNIKYCLYINSLWVISESFYRYSTDVKESLSRTIRSLEDERINSKIETDYLNQMYATANLDEKYLKQIKAADDFCECRQVYSRAKRMKLRGADKKEIMKGIRKDCKEVNSKKMVYPKTNYCRKIYLPVKLRLYSLIYAISMKLAKNV